MAYSRYCDVMPPFFLKVHVRTRPYMAEFLDQVSQWFEIVVFTASDAPRSGPLLDIIDPAGTRIEHRIYRDACIDMPGYFVKDLNILGRDLSKVIILDNTIQAFGYQVSIPFFFFAP